MCSPGHGDPVGPLVESVVAGGEGDGRLHATATAARDPGVAGRAAPAALRRVAAGMRVIWQPS